MSNKMEWLNGIVRPEILKLAAYSSARSEMGDLSGMIQMDANENPYIPYPQSIEVSKANRYPDPQPIALLARLAAIYGVKNDQILVARGMDEIIDLIIRVFCIAYKDKILITPPTYGMYQVAADTAGVEVVKVALSEEDGFEFPHAKIIATAKAEKVKIVFLCTPNNPTGNIISLDKIEAIAKSLPQAIIAVDEAYIEFADTESAASLLKDYPNLVTMKTLSKAYGFAGVRIGSLLAHPDIITVSRKVLAPYPLPEPCVRLAHQLLSPLGLQLVHSRTEILKAERERMLEVLRQLPGIEEVYPSKANFILFKVENGGKIYKDVLAKGIVIRNRAKDVANTLRISIGTPEENNLVLAALGAKLDNLAKVERTATVIRNTNETRITVEVNLDQTSPIQIHTGVGFFDHMLEQLAKHGGFSLKLVAEGDTHIDYHHTVEDVAIALGNALRQALGDKRGINRYGFVLPMDESCAFATIDLSGRGVLVYEAEYQTPLIGNFPVEMVEHFFLSLSDQLQAAIHLKVSGENAHHMVEGLFKACAKALNQAIKQTGDSLPSTKGLL
ncbi:histidinol-phosphate transaminase [Aquella oligotrophica]|uniref:Multifunctional fusion protein n=1 Tax=Aquella oligotrophica TaxID=2067065 RepID=A0A2I7N7V2_9NEIS|nr:histidinol-phosphate transaminase [Aquella oligotrophica]AUR52536.1 imidazoleglycerol-phosphate dehydratase HisB [Aquella oligotrophica]